LFVADRNFHTAFSRLFYAGLPVNKVSPSTLFKPVREIKGRDFFLSVTRADASNFLEV
jgi:hypothetical protein